MGLFLFASLPFAQAQVLHDLFINGPAESRLNLVVLAEGFTASQEIQFTNAATTLLRSFFAVEPFAEYQSYFNAQAIFVASAQAGSDHPLSGVWRDTYFNSSYDSYGRSEIITIPPNEWDSDPQDGSGRVDALLRGLAPQCDLPVLLVNDGEYGGSGGPVLIGSLNTAAVELLLHESGHTLGGLGDEYSDPSSTPPQEFPNATAQTDRARIRWAAWIAPGTPVPTPATTQFTNTIGLFEGAVYQAKGWYRPKFNCRMRTLGVPFCEVCREQIVKRIYAFNRPAENPLPATTNLVIENAAPIDFAITPARPRTHAIQTQWYLDGVPQPGAITNQFTLDALRVTNGLHVVSVVAHDATDWVRNDPAGLLTATFQWQLQVNRPSLQLGTPLVLAGNRIRLTVSGNAPRGFVLDESVDLTHWTAVSTNTLTSGQADIEVPMPSTRSAGFYRAAAR